MEKTSRILDPTRQQGTVQSGGASVMVWSLCSWGEMGPLIRLETALTACCSEEISTTSHSYGFEKCPAGSMGELSPGYLQTSVESIPHRVAALLCVREGPTQYYASVPVFLALQLCFKQTNEQNHKHPSSTFNKYKSNVRHFLLKYSRLSINRDRIIRDDVLPKRSSDCGRWNVREDRISLNPSYCIGIVQPTSSPARLQLDCSENGDEEAVK
ncbi:hypothetical protein AVEN_141646-1 [Araneus ventricosus]|uniref:Uncharacterized protein n=1 Tax=Araneus ventricosus TaxID=182803 RepID=A0A4Y2TS53_ARAVE|nr:hypothetical protein AVEN_141646-1 [Araneus ventricosus]